jgi:hypothetical protein
MKYIVELNVEGSILEIPCKNEKEFKMLSEFLEESFPDKEWRTRVV